MEIELKSFLENYKKYTVELISYLEKEDYNSLEYFMNKRQLALDKLSNQNYDKKGFCKIFEEAGLLEYEQKLEELLIIKKNKVKSYINTLSKIKNANNMYNKDVEGAVVFSKKI